VRTCDEYSVTFCYRQRAVAMGTGTRAILDAAPTLTILILNKWQDLFSTTSSEKGKSRCACDLCKAAATESMSSSHRESYICRRKFSATEEFVESVICGRKNG
jgi:hypothetical protein